MIGAATTREPPVAIRHDGRVIDQGDPWQT
jgi:hypothetical protein